LKKLILNIFLIFFISASAQQIPKIVRSEIIHYENNLIVTNRNYYDNNLDSDLNFTKIVVDSTLDRPWGISCEDLDGDGDVDIVISQNHGVNSLTHKIDWYENIGNFEFIPHNILVTDVYDIFQVNVVDLDNDSDMDIVFVSFGSGGIGLNVLTNDGQMNFTKSMISPNIHWKFEVIDINQDGLLDIVGNNNTYATTIYWVEQNSDHTFTSHLIDNDCGDAYGIDVVDLDSDNDLDIVQGAVNTYDDLYWYENDGNEVFTKHFIDTDIQDPLDLICEDIDSDGDVDIVVPHTQFFFQVNCDGMKMMEISSLFTTLSQIR